MQQGDLKDVHPSLNPEVSHPKIGVIDWGCSGTLAESDMQYFKSLWVRHQIHSIICTNNFDTMICPRGFSCASIICSSRRSTTKFFNVCEEEFEGIYPEAQLYIYTIGCGSCGHQVERNLINNTVKALDKAIKDKVKVVLVCMDMPMNTKDDRVGMKLLEVHKNGILPFVPTGDQGPVEGSTQYGGPWSMIVGARTNKKLLETEIEIATKDEHGNPKTIKRIKGVSLNLIQTPFLPLRVLEDYPTGTACILLADMEAMNCSLIPAHPYYKSTIVGPQVTATPLASITEPQVDLLQELHSEHGGRLFLKIRESKYNEDKCGDLVTNFSSRGPSRLYPDNLIPDVVAPGHAVLTPHPSNIALTNEGEPMFREFTIASGTSYACAQVAAYALKVFFRHPDWLPSAVKSALITTASSFAARSIPDNEFAFGAGSVDINKAMSPGLVYEETSNHFDEYVKQDRTIFDLNLPTFAASFSYSHLECERIFKRELKNVSGREENYECFVKIYDRSLDPNVQITAEPKFLKFKPGEKHIFELRVKILPRPGPGAQVSAMIKWLPETLGGQPVCSPVHLYHESTFEQLTWRQY